MTTNITRIDGPLILFNHEELQCPETKEVVLHPGFGEALAKLRQTFGHSMKVNSCCRSAAHNEGIGGHIRSLHVYDKPNHQALGTLAIDIRRQDGLYGYQLVKLATELGWSVGVAKTFIHLDQCNMVGMSPSVFGYG